MGNSRRLNKYEKEVGGVTLAFGRAGHLRAIGSQSTNSAKKFLESKI